VKRALDAFVDAMNNTRPETMTEVVSTGPDVLGIGSDPDEWWPGSRLLEVIQVQIREMEGAKFEVGETAGNGNWLAAKAQIVAPGGGGRVPGRLTVICDDSGKVEHFHFSIGVSNEEAIGQELTT
jgi:hypothetical protein